MRRAWLGGCINCRVPWVLEASSSKCVGGSAPPPGKIQECLDLIEDSWSAVYYKRCRYRKRGVALKSSVRQDSLGGTGVAEVLFNASPLDVERHLGLTGILYVRSAGEGSTEAWYYQLGAWYHPPCVAAPSLLLV